ncbi:hypothetical protein [Clostridium saccharoperbutylacetonicum]
MILDLLLILFIIILVVIIIKERKNKNQIINLVNNYYNLWDKTKNEYKEKDSINLIQEKTINNYKNAIEFIKGIKNKCYVEFGELNEGHELNIKEQIVIVIYESDIRYDSEYYDQYCGCDAKPYISTIKLDCQVFVDSRSIDPITDVVIYKSDKTTSLEDINLLKYKGKGIGTYVVQTLIKVLENYNITELKAGLSSVDYDVKERLYNFYQDINGFEIIKKIEKDSWGMAIKKIKI